MTVALSFILARPPENIVFLPMASSCRRTTAEGKEGECWSAGRRVPFKYKPHRPTYSTRRPVISSGSPQDLGSCGTRHGLNSGDADPVPDPTNTKGDTLITRRGNVGFAVKPTRTRRKVNISSMNGNLIAPGSSILQARPRMTPGVRMETRRSRRTGENPSSPLSVVWVTSSRF